MREKQELTQDMHINMIRSKFIIAGLRQDMQMINGIIYLVVNFIQYIWLGFIYLFIYTSWSIASCPMDRSLKQCYQKPTMADGRGIFGLNAMQTLWQGSYSVAFCHFHGAVVLVGAVWQFIYVIWCLGLIFILLFSFFFIHLKLRKENSFFPLTSLCTTLADLYRRCGTTLETWTFLTI